MSETSFSPEHDLYNKIMGLPADDKSFEALFDADSHRIYNMFRDYRRAHADLAAIRFKVMDENEPVVTGLHWANVYMDWSWKGCGFGQLSFSLDRETGKLICMNECMGRDSVRKILIAMANKIADEVVLEE
jgi:hypothetical protein